VRIWTTSVVGAPLGLGFVSHELYITLSGELRLPNKTQLPVAGIGKLFPSVLGCSIHEHSLLPEALWNLIQPLLPPSPRRPNGGRPRLPDRACFTGILFVLRSGIPWEMLPQELGCGSGMTCWRRLRDWQEAGTWQLIHFSLLDWLARHGEIDWSRAVVDGSSIRAVFGGCRRDRIPPTGPSWAANVI
jgi:transposase